MSKLDEIKEELKEENEKAEEVERKITEEVKRYGEDLKEMNFKDDVNQPIIQKICFILVGVTNFVIGFALYFLMKNHNKDAWQNKYLLVGGFAGIVVELIIIISEIVEKI